MEYVYPDGTPVPEGVCLFSDWYVTTYEFRTDEWSDVDLQAIRDSLEEKWEVLEVVQIAPDHFKFKLRSRSNRSIMTVAQIVDDHCRLISMSITHEQCVVIDRRAG